MVETVAVLPSTVAISIVATVPFPSRSYPPILIVGAPTPFAVAPGPIAAVPVVIARSPNVIGAWRNPIGLFIDGGGRSVRRPDVVTASAAGKSEDGE